MLEIIGHMNATAPQLPCKFDDDVTVNTLNKIEPVLHNEWN